MNDIHLPHWLVVASWTVAEVCRHPLTPSVSVRNGQVEGVARYREYGQLRRARATMRTGAFVADRAYSMLVHRQCLNRSARRRTRLLGVEETNDATSMSGVAALKTDARGRLHGGGWTTDGRERRVISQPRLIDARPESSSTSVE